jgi:hypothetical protein
MVLGASVNRPGRHRASGRSARWARTWVALVAALLLVGDCSASVPAPAASPVPAATIATATATASGSASVSTTALSECAAAVRAAAVPNDMQEVTSLDRAIRDCATLADLAAAAVAYPAALKGVSATDIVTYRCQVEPTLASTAICRALPK